MKQVLLPIRISATAGALWLISSCDKPAGSDAKAGGNPMDIPQRVEVMPITSQTLRETVGLVGSIAANESVELRPEIAGTILQVSFEEGRPIRRGEPLVVLDTRELEAQLAETKASFQLAEQTLQRNRTLLEDAAVSQLEVDAAVAEHARLQAAIQQLEVRIAKSTIVAPFDGVTGARPVSVGDYISQQSVVTTVDDLSRLKVEMQVPERFLPSLQPGSTFTLRAATSPEGETIEGEVYFLSPRIDEATRSTLVKGIIKQPPPYLKPGMFANITLVLRTVENALVVPETAILSSPRGTVLVMPKEADGTTIAEFVPVKTGIRIPGLVQVSPVGPPIKEGDRIVSAGVGGLILFPGRKLEPVEPVVTPELPSDTDRNLK